MIHDEGIEKAITWLCEIDSIRKRQMIMAIIGGLRELQTARTELLSLGSQKKALIEIGNKLSDATMTYEEFANRRQEYYALLKEME